MSNPHEELNRQRKARRIVTYLWDHMKPADRVDPETLMVVRCADQEMRDLVAKMAQCHSPSTATWALVTIELSKRIQDARWGKEQTT